MNLQIDCMTVVYSMNSKMANLSLPIYHMEVLIMKGMKIGVKEGMKEGNGVRHRAEAQRRGGWGISKQATDGIAVRPFVRMITTSSGALR